MSQLVFYLSDDGRTSIHFRAADGTVWLTLRQLAELYGTTKQNVSLHVRKILAEGEPSADAIVKEDLTVQVDGKPSVISWCCPWRTPSWDTYRHACGFCLCSS